MSSSSYTTDCPRCGGIGTISACQDSRPCETISGECLRCGFTYYTKFDVMPQEELEEIRNDAGMTKKPKLSKKAKKWIEDFDLNYGIKKVE